MNDTKQSYNVYCGTCIEYSVIHDLKDKDTTFFNFLM